MVILSLLWGIFGKIPITVSGRGVLLHPIGKIKTSTLIAVAFLDMSDGLRVKPGMKILIAPDLVKREKFGSILGKIIDVSQNPATVESARKVIGNSRIAQKMVGEDGEKIKVIAQLQTDRNNPSGLKWTASKGPDFPAIAGTQITATITVEERPPLSFVLPFIYK
jgi:HlyD family secretion protein